MDFVRQILVVLTVLLPALAYFLFQKTEIRFLIYNVYSYEPLDVFRYVADPEFLVDLNFNMYVLHYINQSDSDSDD